MAADKQDKVLNSSSEREQSGACSSSAEREKNQGKNFLNVPNKREQSQTCLNSAERAGLHTKGNVPNLRFPEFTDEWEKHTLGEMGNGLIGLTYSPTEIVGEGGIIVFRSSNIQNGEISYDDIIRVKKNIKDNIITRAGDLLICARNGSTRLIGKNTLLSNEDTGQTFGAFMLIYRSDENQFIHKLLNTKKYTTQVSENLGARINQITSANLSEFEFYFPPTKVERDKIAKFLNLINKRIKTQNRIIEDLRSLKVYIHNRIFSKGNTLFGQRNTIRLSDIATKITRKNKGNAINNVLSNSAAMGIVPQAEVFDKEIANENNTANYYVIGNGDFVYNPRKSAQAPFGPINMYKGQMEGIISPLYLCFQVTNINKNYLLHYFMSNVWYSYIYSNGDTGVRHDRVSIKDETFLDMPLYIHTIDKQQEIATMMNQVDAKIALEEIYLTKLQKQKDFLLAAMFV